jgi:thiol-disulfide isomerase/thioredoxin
MPIKLLTDANFSLKQKQLICTTGSKGSTLVLFKKPGCPGCQAFAPVFEQLDREYGQFGIGFASIDIERYKKVLVLAKNSETPLPHVPFLLLYIGAVPRYKYTGTMNIVSLRNFCREFPEAQQHQAEETQYAPQGYGGRSNAPTDLSHNSRRNPHGARSGYMTLGGGDDEGCNELICPTNVIPHNSPWKSEYHKMDLNLEGERG